MPSKYRCPSCNSDNILEYEKTIECPHCKRSWHKDFIDSDIEKDHILSDQELDAFLDAFEELKDEKERKRFLKSLEDDLR